MNLFKIPNTMTLNNGHTIEYVKTLFRKYESLHTETYLEYRNLPDVQRDSKEMMDLLVRVAEVEAKRNYLQMAINNYKSFRNTVHQYTFDSYLLSNNIRYLNYSEYLANIKTKEGCVKKDRSYADLLQSSKANVFSNFKNSYQGYCSKSNIKFLAEAVNIHRSDLMDVISQISGDIPKIDNCIEQDYSHYEEYITTRNKLQEEFTKLYLEDLNNLDNYKIFIPNEIN